MSKPHDHLQTMTKLRKENNLTIMSNPHAHLQTMNKTSAKFQKYQTKIVGVALPKHSLIASEIPKMTKFTSWKK